MADAAGGEVGGRPTLPFARAVDHPRKHPDRFKVKTATAPNRYCPKCFVAVAVSAKEKCTNCGAPLKGN